MRQVAEYIRDLEKLNKTVFVITHDLELIYSCCNYVLHFEQGKVKDFYPLKEEKTESLNEFFKISVH